MSRRYQEQVEVRLGVPDEHGVRLEGALPPGAPGSPEVPTLFLWRGRVHVVRAVLARWSQRVPWWRADDDPVDATDATEESSSWSELERVVWRVEAGAGRSVGTGVYDLVHGERWWLDRVAD